MSIFLDLAFKNREKALNMRFWAESSGDPDERDSWLSHSKLCFRQARRFIRAERNLRQKFERIGYDYASR